MLAISSTIDGVGLLLPPVSRTVGSFRISVGPTRGRSSGDFHLRVAELRGNEIQVLRPLGSGIDGVAGVASEARAGAWVGSGIDGV